MFDSSGVTEVGTPKRSRSKHGTKTSDFSEKPNIAPKSPAAPSYVVAQRHATSSNDRIRRTELSRNCNEENEGSPQSHEQDKEIPRKKTGKPKKKKDRNGKSSRKDSQSREKLEFDKPIDVECGKPNISYSTDESIDTLSDSHQEEMPVVDLKSVDKGHLSWFAHGRYLTIFSIVTALAGLSLSIASRKSLAFVKLEQSISFSPFVKNVTKVGLMRVEICFLDEIYTDTSEFPIPQGTDNAWKVDFDDYGRDLLSGQVESTSGDDELVGCRNIPLTTENVEDTLWNVARSFLFLAIVLGSLVTVFLCSSCYWETINLKPVSVGLLIAYFFQSLGFFFFDSDLCREYQCSLAEGSILSIFASLMWFASGLGSIRMHIVYHRRLREERKRKRRQERKQKKQMKSKLDRSLSEGTTSISSGESPPRSISRFSMSSLESSSDLDVSSFGAEDAAEKGANSHDAHTRVA